MPDRELDTLRCRALAENAELRRRILHLMRGGDPWTRAELRRVLKLDTSEMPRLSRQLFRLREQGLIEQLGHKRHAMWQTVPGVTP